MKKRSRIRWTLVVGVILSGLATGAIPTVHGETAIRTLTDTELALIYGGSAVAFTGGVLSSHLHGDGPPPGNYNPLGIDHWFRRLLHGETAIHSNFLDSKLGSALTPVGALIAISIIDIDREEFSRDVPMYIAGLAATQGITRFSKNLIGRPRPYCLDGGCPPPDLAGDDPYHRRSFISGHTSSAFFAAAFFNQRFRRHMRSNWTTDDYKTGRWLSPVVSFGWAGIVGLSRIHADKHYFTDVIAGALVGVAMGELYYHFAYETVEGSKATNGSASRVLGFSLSFPL